MKSNTKQKVKQLSLSGVVATGLLLALLIGPAAVYGYGYGYGHGYGYNCEGGYGYGYLCDDSGDDDSSNSSSVIVDDEEDDLPGGSTIKKYKKYKKKYKNKSAKEKYRELKMWKKGVPENQAKYFEYRGWYYQYKHLSKSERKEYLTPEIYWKVKMYKKYKGYKKYKKLRKKMGR